MVRLSVRIDLYVSMSLKFFLLSSLVDVYLLNINDLISRCTYRRYNCYCGLKVLEERFPFKCYLVALSWTPSYVVNCASVNINL